MTDFDLTMLMIGAGFVLGLRTTIRDFWRWWRNERPDEADEAPGDWPFVHPRIHAGGHAASAAARKSQSEATE